ncbi:hypothetical protein H310_15401 [Aphanomyces invadans]|uniref:Uncharacterized protein n=1 Tax=Aphanomyces invadans TaxID=157072 RepID=A0A024T7F6_9STRA|nr:hypothetical protein H310_15401 [Aphanomyces invadans]ETV89770.1 hypothetical protein H310_15401 [Aphanomyces invadans]|eukprot:XP_008881598.1 hypothetical protein H310_15401 [Aphanomyces invadans]
MENTDYTFALFLVKWAKRKKFRPKLTMALYEYALGLPIERPLIPDKLCVSCSVVYATQ